MRGGRGRWIEKWMIESLLLNLKRSVFILQILRFSVAFGALEVDHSISPCNIYQSGRFRKTFLLDIGHIFALQNAHNL